MNLAIIGKADILPRLYGKVLIPEAVFQELTAAGTPEFITHPMAHPTWIEVANVSAPALAASLRLELDAGEAEAIALGVELSAHLTSTGRAPLFALHSRSRGRRRWIKHLP